MNDETQSQQVSRRSTLAMAASFSALASFIGASAQAQEDANDQELKSEIEAVLDRTAELWRGGAKDKLLAIWDTDDPEPWYVPEEIREAYTSWPEIKAYWGPRRGGGLADFRWGYANAQVKRLAPDIALAMFDHFYELTRAGEGVAPIGGFDRCLAIFRKKADGWRYILYAQCPLGPETYVRAMREQIIKPDFDTFQERLTNK